MRAMPRYKHRQFPWSTHTANVKIGSSSPKELTKFSGVLRRRIYNIESRRHHWTHSITFHFIQVNNYIVICARTSCLTWTWNPHSCREFLPSSKTSIFLMSSILIYRWQVQRYSESSFSLCVKHFSNASVKYVVQFMCYKFICFIKF